MRKENSWSNYFNLLKSLQCRQATFRKKNGNVDEKMLPDTSGLVTASVLNTKTYEVEDKILDTSNLMISTVHNPKIGEVENKVHDHTKFYNWIR